MNRAKEILKTLDKLGEDFQKMEEKYQDEVATLKGELRNIRQQCKHDNKKTIKVIPVIAYRHTSCNACNDCGYVWWD